MPWGEEAFQDEQVRVGPTVQIDSAHEPATGGGHRPIEVAAVQRFALSLVPVVGSRRFVDHHSVPLSYDGTAPRSVDVHVPYRLYHNAEHTAMGLTESLSQPISPAVNGRTSPPECAGLCVAPL